MAAAAPDGYTIAMGHLGTLSAAPALFPDLRYKPLDGIQHIGVAGGTPILIVAKKDFSCQGPEGVRGAISRQTRPSVNEAHAGVGAVSWTTCTLLKAQLGLPNLNSVPYRGTGPALNDLVGGQVDFMCDQIPSVIGQVKAGTINAYAIASEKPVRQPCPISRQRLKPACPASRSKPGMASSAPWACLLMALDQASSMRWTRRLKTPNTKKRLEDLGAVIPSRRLIAHLLVSRPSSSATLTS